MNRFVFKLSVVCLIYFLRLQLLDLSYCDLKPLLSDVLLGLPLIALFGQVLHLPIQIVHLPANFGLGPF